MTYRSTHVWAPIGKTQKHAFTGRHEGTHTSVHSHQYNTCKHEHYTRIYMLRSTHEDTFFLPQSCTTCIVSQTHAFPCTHISYITPKAHKHKCTHQPGMNHEYISPTPSCFPTHYVRPLNPPSPWLHNPLNFSPILYPLPLTPRFTLFPLLYRLSSSSSSASSTSQMRLCVWIRVHPCSVALNSDVSFVKCCI